MCYFWSVFYLISVYLPDLEVSENIVFSFVRVVPPVLPNIHTRIAPADFFYCFVIFRVHFSAI